MGYDDDEQRAERLTTSQRRIASARVTIQQSRLLREQSKRLLAARVSRRTP